MDIVKTNLNFGELNKAVSALSHNTNLQPVLFRESRRSLYMFPETYG